MSFSYKHFTDLYDIPYMIVAFLYIGALLIFTTIVIWTRLVKYCIRKKRRKGACQDAYQGACCNAYNGFFKQFEKLNSWILRLIFGKSEGVTEGGGEDDENDPETIEISKRVYISGRKLKTIDVNILGSIVVCFVLLMGINAYGTYLLEVSHTCSDDSGIYCFPLPFDPNTSEVLVPENLLMEPIDNCIEWTNSTIAPFITFQCFRYALNADGALAVAGGLLGLFTIITRTAISTITWIFKTCKLYKKKNCINGFQITIAALLLILDIVAAVVVIAFQLLSSLGQVENEVDPTAQKIAAYIADNGIQIVVGLGTVGLLLLIPWASYTDPNTTTEDVELGQLELTDELTPQDNGEVKIRDPTQVENTSL